MEAEEPESRKKIQAVRELEKSISRRAFIFESSEALMLLGRAIVYVLVGLSLIPLVLSQFLGYSFNNILTNSMTPELPVGSVVVTEPYLGQQLEKGEIIGFYITGGHQVIHRIDAVETEQGELSGYATKGDANDSADAGLREPEHIWGVAINVIEGPLAFFISHFSWDGHWLAQLWLSLTSGDWEAFGVLISQTPWGALGLLIAIVLFTWVLPNFFVRLGNRLVREDESKRKALEEAFQSQAAEFKAESAASRNSD